MRKVLVSALFLVSCKTTPEPVCQQPKEIVTVAKESCGVQVEFTPSVDQAIPGVVICVLDPSVPAMLCMTPKEAADRAAPAGPPK